MRNFGDPLSSWPRRVLFALNLLLAAALIMLVVFSPLLVPMDSTPPGGATIAALFAHEPAVRRAAIASAIGLTVTAFVFFRSPGGKRAGSSHSSRLPPGPGNIVGA